MVCMAALHSGLLSDIRASELRIQMMEKVQQYPCGPTEWDECSLNGVTSQSKDEWNRGFKFIGGGGVCSFFK